MVDLEDRAGVVTHAAHQRRVVTQTARLNHREKFSKFGCSNGCFNVQEPSLERSSNRLPQTLGQLSNHTSEFDLVEHVDRDPRRRTVSLGNTERTEQPSK